MVEGFWSRQLDSIGNGRLTHLLLHKSVPHWHKDQVRPGVADMVGCLPTLTPFLSFCTMGGINICGKVSWLTIKGSCSLSKVWSACWGAEAQPRTTFHISSDLGGAMWPALTNGIWAEVMCHFELTELRSSDSGSSVWKMHKFRH